MNTQLKHGEQARHETRFLGRQKASEDHQSSLTLDDVWPINDTKCTVHRIHQPSKEQFNEECMEPGTISRFRPQTIGNTMWGNRASAREIIVLT